MIHEIHDFLHRDHCEFCRMYDEDDRYRTLVDQAAAGRRQAIPLPCRFVGAAVPGTEYAREGLSVVRSWWICEKGLGTVPGFTCFCADCGPQCPGYEAEVIGDKLELSR